MQIDMAS